MSIDWQQFLEDHGIDRQDCDDLRHGNPNAGPCRVSVTAGRDRQSNDLLNTAVDKVLAHKPKPKSKPARKRARRAKKLAKA